MDIIWVFANNPTTATMRAIRWHQEFMPGRALGYTEKHIHVDTWDMKEAAKLDRKQRIIYQYAVWYKIRSGHAKGNKVAAFSFGENPMQARKLARTYFPIIVESRDEKGIHCIERLKIEKEQSET